MQAFSPSVSGRSRIYWKLLSKGDLFQTVDNLEANGQNFSIPIAFLAKNGGPEDNVSIQSCQRSSQTSWCDMLSIQVSSGHLLGFFIQ